MISDSEEYSGFDAEWCVNWSFVAYLWVETLIHSLTHTHRFNQPVIFLLLLPLLCLIYSDPFRNVSPYFQILVLSPFPHPFLHFFHTFLYLLHSSVFLSLTLHIFPFPVYSLHSYFSLLPPSNPSFPSLHRPYILKFSYRLHPSGFLPLLPSYPPFLVPFLFSSFFPPPLPPNSSISPSILSIPLPTAPSLTHTSYEVNPSQIRRKREAKTACLLKGGNA